MKTFCIESHAIGGSPFIIAEIGVNHDGSLDRARQLVRAARDAGADAVKLQIFRARQLMHPSALMAAYQRDAVHDADPMEMLSRLELSQTALAELTSLIRECGMTPLATPFSPADVETIRELALPAVKIASPDIVNRPLLNAVMELKIPMIVSTGAATIEELDRTAWWLDSGRANWCFMHCTSSYPSQAADTNLCWIDELRRRFNVPIGFSDHTTSTMSGALATAAGATLLEKHLTYDKTAAGPDHSASAEPDELAVYARLAREAAVYRGSGSKRVLDSERDVRSVSRQSLVLTRDIQPGEPLNESSLTVQRPGTGASAADLSRAVGAIARTTLRAGTILQWDMLAA